MKKKLTMLLLLAAALCFSATYRPQPVAAAATLIVDDNLDCPGAQFNTIQAAVIAAAPGDVIQVCAGTYNENVNVPAAKVGLTINGAQAGFPHAGRVFASPAESTVRGVALPAGTAVFTVNAPNVTLDGFSVSNPGTGGTAFGITIRGGADGALVTNNIIDTVTAPASTGSGGHGVYIENSTTAGVLAPDNVVISDNRINNIQGGRSTKGILIGVNNGSNPSLNVVIEGNEITNIVSNISGAYGISVANPASSTSGVTGLSIRDNTISDLIGGTGVTCPPSGTPPTVPATCGWVHAIGLEGNTPGAVVRDNVISNLTGTTADKAAVFFQNNSSIATVAVNDNDFNVAPPVFGINLHSTQTGGPVNGTCNFWGNASGPGPAGPGTGALVHPSVDYTPWQTAPEGPCDGGDADEDGVDDANDNCPTTPNSNQADADGDGFGDVCDTCPNDPANDADGDGVCGDVDTCPGFPDQADADSDGIADGCDPCPNTPGVSCPVPTNKEQCKNDGWKTLFRPNGSPFKNQGDCVSFMASGK